MQNRWEVTVEQSNYDFNPFRESDHGKSFKTIANMYPSWKDEIPIANANQYDFYWPSPVAPPIIWSLSVKRQGAQTLANVGHRGMQP